MKDIEGKIAFVTGGASGIGLGITRAFVSAGMKVVIADIRQDHLNDATALFAEAGLDGMILPMMLDVTDRAAFVKAADAAEEHFGRLHVLVNNAGIGILGSIKQVRASDWDWGIDVNIRGVANGIAAILPKLLAHGEGGHIISTASKAALLPIPDTAVYTMTKAAVVGLSECMRGELAADGIGVSVFCPGPVASNIHELGKMRPERYRDTGIAAIEERLARGEVAGVWMDPLEAGERVLAGLRNNDLYILTNREFKEGVAERFDAILASFPDEPINEARRAGHQRLISNPIFAESLANSRDRSVDDLPGAE